MLLAGCAAVDPAPRLAEVDEMVRPVTGAPLSWPHSPEESARAQASVRTLLADGLTRSDAIRIAVLQNRALQASLEEIGIAEAERVQAGLLTNPSLSLVLVFPADLGDTSATLLGMLSDLWTKPVDEAIAERALGATLRRVAAKVVATAAAAAIAYDAVLYGTAREELERIELVIRRERLDDARGGRGSPAEADGGAQAAESDVLDQELSVAQARKELTQARLELETTLGLDGTEPLPPLVDSLDLPPPAVRRPEEVVPFALENRFDVAAARLALEGAEQNVERERLEVYGEVGVGPSYDGGLGDFDGGGPALGVELPIFDQNQAGIARAEYQVRRRQRLLEETRLRARSEVLAALAEAEYRRKRAEIAAARSRTAERLAARGGSAGRGLEDAETREERLELRRRSLEATLQLRKAETDLQRALWAAGADA